MVRSVCLARLDSVGYLDLNSTHLSSAHIISCHLIVTIVSSLTQLLGPCQFPTLGFVVDRFWRVKAFVPEDFWYLKCVVEKEGESAELSWSRNRLFDQLACAILFERCMVDPTAVVTSMETKPTSKWFVSHIISGSGLDFMWLACGTLRLV